VPELPNADAQDALQNELLAPWILYLWYPPDAPSQALLQTGRFAAKISQARG